MYNNFLAAFDKLGSASLVYSRSIECNLAIIIFSILVLYCLYGQDQDNSLFDR
jgi:hypothetical protein